MGPTKFESRHLINGKWVDSKSGKTFKMINPYTEEETAQVAFGQPEDVDAAVEAALKAQKSWAEVPAMEKAALLNKFADAIEAHADELAEIESISMGMPSSNKAFAGLSVPIIRLAAACCLTTQFGYSSLVSGPNVNMTLRQPFGVVAVITPWNGPLAGVAGKVIPAIAAGNTVVLKPSEKAPLTSIFAAKLANDIFPPGVFNVVNGEGPTTGYALSSHMKIRKITFTGSGRSGKLVMKAAAESNLKNVSLELGGKSPVLVFEDADLAKAANSCAFSIFMNSGQICCAHSRVYVQKSIASKFIEEYKKAFKALSKIGDPLKAETTQGPQVDEAQFKRVMGFIEEAKKEATLEMGGNRVGEKGYFVEPTVFTDVKRDARINVDEVFGPVSVIHTFETEEEAIEYANDTEFGLSSGVFTTNITRALRVAKALDAGGVGINQNLTISWDVPFGGTKQSGIGREYGKHTLDEFLEEKTVVINMT